MHCWELRGCDDEMQSRCPHNVPGEPCPADCHFAACERPTHKVTSNLDLLFRCDIDREQSVKDICRFCEFFLAMRLRRMLKSKRKPLSGAAFFVLIPSWSQGVKVC